MTIECYHQDKVNVKITAKGIVLDDNFVGKWGLVDKKDDKILLSGSIEFYKDFLVARVDTNIELDTGKTYKTYELLLQIENIALNMRKTYSIDLKIKTNAIRII